MDTLGLNHIYRVYQRVPGDVEVERKLVGRFMVHDNELTILEDYFGVLDGFLKEGALTEKDQQGIQRLKHSPYYDVASEGDIKAGHRLDLIPEADPKPAAPQPMMENPDPAVASPYAGDPVDPEEKPRAAGMPDVYEYMRVGMSTPHIIEVYDDGRVLGNGIKLEDDEIKHIFDTVDVKIATLRPRRS
jgi:hypothetical protein